MIEDIPNSKRRRKTRKKRRTKDKRRRIKEKKNNKEGTKKDEKDEKKNPEHREYTISRILEDAKDGAKSYGAYDKET